MSQIRLPFVQTRRDAWVEVDLGNIEHNIKALKSYVKPEVKFLAVIKADAYGHGATMVAPTLAASGVDMFGVASVDEGIQLREAGINIPILVLGTAPTWSFVTSVENDIQLSIFTEEHLNECLNVYNRLGKKPKVQIKVDTGMNRIGIPYQSAQEFINKVINSEFLILEGIFTHLACAEDQNNTEIQRQAWNSLIKEFDDKNIMLHSVNTAGLISYEDLHYDMVRAGIGIYGLKPDLSPTIQNISDFKQVMSLKGRIVHIKDIPADSGISYSYSYKTDDESKIATIPIGYADGVPRALSNKIFGLINGHKIRQVGNITMDQMMFDVSNVGNVNVGDIITLLGEDNGEFITIDSWAEELNTINYEITCRLKIRLPRVYTRNS